MAKVTLRISIDEDVYWQLEQVRVAKRIRSLGKLVNDILTEWLKSQGRVTNVTITSDEEIKTKMTESRKSEVQKVKSTSSVEMSEPHEEETKLPPEVEEQISEVTEQAKMEEKAKTKRKLKSYLYSPYCPICQLTYANVRPIFSEKASGKWIHRIYVKCDKCGAEFLMKLDRPWSLEEFRRRFEKETGKFVGEEIPWEELKREFQIEGAREEE